jgi:hypothetical protein
MMKKILFLILPLIFSLSLSGKSELKKVNKIIINPGSLAEKNYNDQWERVVDEKSIYNWGKSIGVSVNGDILPLVDKKAGFILKTGSNFKITGFNSSLKYNIYIDFVNFEIPKESLIAGKLKIKIYNKRDFLLKILLLNEISKINPYLIEVPLEISRVGEFNLSIEEFSSQTGLWGIWDLTIIGK